MKTTKLPDYIWFYIRKTGSRWYAVHSGLESIGGTRTKRDLIKILENIIFADVIGDAVLMPMKNLNEIRLSWKIHKQ